MHDTDLAYLAGVLDSDGYITVNRTQKKCEGPNGQKWVAAVSYHPKVGITGTRPQPHELAKSLLGGSISSHQPKNPDHRKVYTWCCQGPTAANCLRLVLPYLRVKHQQALLAIELAELITAQFTLMRATAKPPYRLPPNMVAERERLWEAVGVLNQPKNRRVHFPTTGRGIS